MLTKYLVVKADRVDAALVEYGKFILADTRKLKGNALGIQVSIPKEADPATASVILLGSKLTQNYAYKDLLSRPLQPEDFGSEKTITNQIMLNLPREAYTAMIVAKDLEPLLGTDIIMAVPINKPTFDNVDEYNKIGIAPEPQQMPWLSQIELKIPSHMTYADWLAILELQAVIECYMSYKKIPWNEI